MVRKTMKNPLERFAKLEKIEKVNDERGKFVQQLSDVTGKENIIIPMTRAEFFDLYGIYENKPVKIFQTEDKLCWVVMYNE